MVDHSTIKVLKDLPKEIDAIRPVAPPKRVEQRKRKRRVTDR